MQEVAEAAVSAVSVISLQPQLIVMVAQVALHLPELLAAQVVQVVLLFPHREPLELMAAVAVAVVAQTEHLLPQDRERQVGLVLNTQ
jgi:hypothetical protein